jgi:hypothetical protein
MNTTQPRQVNKAVTDCLNGLTADFFDEEIVRLVQVWINA